MTHLERYTKEQNDAAAAHHAAQVALAAQTAKQHELQAELHQIKSAREDNPRDVDAQRLRACEQRLAPTEGEVARAGFGVRRTSQHLAECVAQLALGIENKVLLAKVDALAPAAEKMAADFTAKVWAAVDALADAAKDVAIKLQPLNDACAAVPYQVGVTRPLSNWENLAHGRVAFLERALYVARAVEAAAQPPSTASLPNKDKKLPPEWRERTQTLDTFGGRGSWEPLI
jgi:hypothetical protein